MAEDRNDDAVNPSGGGGTWQPPSGVAEDRNLVEYYARVGAYQVAAALRGG